MQRGQGQEGLMLLSRWRCGRSRKELGREPEKTLGVAKPGKNKRQASSRAPGSE